MASFEIIYEEEEDVLEATFAVFDEPFSRAIPLNENIVIHTDTGVSTVWGISIYSYAQMLQVSETHLDGLREMEAGSLARIWNVLRDPPVCYFLNVFDPAGFRALVKAPNLLPLLDA